MEPPFALALTIFESSRVPIEQEPTMVYPNPADCGVFIPYEFAGILPVQIFELDGRLITETTLDFSGETPFLAIPKRKTEILVVVVKDDDGKVLLNEQVMVK